MKIFPFKIPKAQNIGLIYQEDKEVLFYDKLHQHEEIQLCCIVNGEGTLVVGDTVNSYQSGDVLVIGSNLPHVFKSNSLAVSHSFMISLFFTKDSFGKDFFMLDDFKELLPFFEKSLTGCKVIDKEKTIFNLFLSLQKGGNLTRFMGLIAILQAVSLATTTPLSDFIYPKKYSDNEGKRMRDIMDYTITNFDKNIDLKTIASIANMTPNAFCRYFKQRTNKTYFWFLNELRIENACKLFRTNTELPISEVAYDCGFTNISNFNRQFKKIKGITPSEYRKG